MTAAAITTIVVFSTFNAGSLKFVDDAYDLIQIYYVARIKPDHYYPGSLLSAL